MSGHAPRTTFEDMIVSAPILLALALVPLLFAALLAVVVLAVMEGAALTVRVLRQTQRTMIPRPTPRACLR